MSEEDKVSSDEFAARAIDGDGVIGNYIVVAEMMTENGMMLNYAISDGLTPWSGDGMLNYVRKILDASMFGYIDDSEPEEEV